MSWPTTLPELLDRSADEFPERDAIVATDRRLTYAELRDRANQFARGLLANGVRRGDRVGVLMSNRPEWFVANFAIQRIGATMVGLNTWYTADELEYALSATDVSTVVTVDSFLDTDFTDLLVDIAPDVAEGEGPIDSAAFPYLRRVVVVGDAPTWALGWSAVLGRGANVDEGRLETAAATVTSDDDAYVLFSSGTTGRPKPIVLGHDGLATNPRSVGARMGITGSDRFWLAVPLFFSFAACNASMTALSHGATLVLQEQFDPDVALDRITEEDCTVLYGMGNMYRQLEDVDRDLTSAFESVRVAMVIAPRTLRERLETYGIDDVLTGYGLTEVCAICAVTDHTAPRETRMDTVGFPLANVDVRVVDPETGREVPPGDEGEIRLRSRTLFREYRGMPEQTRSAIDGDGYFRTGDLGRLTPTGRLVFAGRLKDIIKTGGINVSPAEVEGVLDEHPDVAEATVFGLPDEERDEVVATVVRPVEGATLEPEGIREHCREHLSSYKVPREVVVWEDPLPRTATGKVQKNVVRERLELEE